MFLILSQGTMLVPPWLEPLLKTSFFSICQNHGNSCRSEKNMYCLECNDGSFCSNCRTSNHKDHQVIQIRRSSYHDVVRVSEIQKVLDINGVQSYVINSARVLFLNERPQPKTQPISSVHNYNNYACNVCGRSLLDTFTFCSLGCKVVGMKKNGNASVTSSTDQINEVHSNRRRMTKKRMSQSRRGEREEWSEGSRQEMVYPPSSTHETPLPSSTTKRRKGTPHRAPFGCPI
ncbi:protein RGF1 INDUCIBLE TRANSCRIPTION FACTOR 1-like [Impatiens glandulifera]|uniref:protein RGF1 INDUCIBLE TRANSCRIPTION FACTOR 1-like n=1 Tax=Impatiens glandulifera TaxID=253017 RepID=UPI001FB082FA|nr:protein RGF1 INDUCIBLE TRANSCRIPTION FACTOR 1-like [Impatiens glandulifera]